MELKEKVTQRYRSAQIDVQKAIIELGELQNQSKNILEQEKAFEEQEKAIKEQRRICEEKKKTLQRQNEAQQQEVDVLQKISQEIQKDLEGLMQLEQRYLDLPADPPADPPADLPVHLPVHLPVNFPVPIPFVPMYRYKGNWVPVEEPKDKIAEFLVIEEWARSNLPFVCGVSVRPDNHCSEGRAGIQVEEIYFELVDEATMKLMLTRTYLESKSNHAVYLIRLFGPEIIPLILRAVGRCSGKTDEDINQACAELRTKGVSVLGDVRRRVYTKK